MTNGTSVTPTTGPGSTSFLVWLSTFVPGLLGAVDAAVTKGTPTHTAVLGLGGAVLALGSSIGKLLHDRGLHIATIQAAGSDVAQALPGLTADLTQVRSFVEQEWPTSKGVIDEVTRGLGELRSKVESFPDVEELVRAVTTALAARLSPAPPSPASAPAAPSTAT